MRALSDNRCCSDAVVPAAAAATTACAANDLCMAAVAVAAAFALPATSTAPRNRRRCAAFPRGFRACERAARTEAYHTANRAPSPTDVVVLPAEVAV